MEQTKHTNMKILQIDPNKARKLYPTASPEFKEMLEDSFGKPFFSQKITERINSFLDILDISGKRMEEVFSSSDEPHVAAYKRLCLTAAVYREGVVLDPYNTNQRKYYPWHEIVKDASKPSGFGLSYYDFDYWNTYSGVGVRLCVDSSEKAIDMGKKFISDYEIFKLS